MPTDVGGRRRIGQLLVGMQAATDYLVSHLGLQPAEALTKMQPSLHQPESPCRPCSR